MLRSTSPRTTRSTWSKAFIYQLGIVSGFIFHNAHLSSHHGLQPGPVGPAPLGDEHHGHGGPHPLEVGLQGVKVEVGGYGPGLPLKSAPVAIVQGGTLSQ